MVRLQANAQNATLAHGITAMRLNPDLAGSQHQILVTHELGGGSGNFRRDSPVQTLQLSFSRLVIQNELTKLADGLALDPGEALLIVRIQNQAAYIILIGIDQRIAYDVFQRHIGQGIFGGNALTF